MINFWQIKIDYFAFFKKIKIIDKIVAIRTSKNGVASGYP
jgi:hypothetical protein